MVGHHPTSNSQHRHRKRPQQEDLKVCWANVGRSSPCHISILQIAYQEKIDVLCIQEPFTCSRSRTSTHPGFQHYAPIDQWDDLHRNEAGRPRVMTYIRK
ncbi:hypothetical protein P153DRAFT_303231, partial [Dothidotthia symphoricarpi CBS 119687]